MIIDIYTLFKSHSGYVPSDTLIAKITYEENITNIECIDGALREKIISILSKPIYYRKSCGTDEKSISFSYELLNPSDPSFLTEILLRLRQYNLYAKLS